VLDKAEYSAFESTLNSTIVSYRIAFVLGLLNFQNSFSMHFIVSLLEFRLNKLELSEFKRISCYQSAAVDRSPRTN